MRHFQPQALQEYLASGAQPVLLDVRESWEYKICHLPNSQHIPMGQIILQLADLDLDPAQEIVVICHHGIRSQQIAYFLESRGFQNVINLSGGINAWATDVALEMTTY